jgi:hypothetical protein
VESGFHQGLHFKISRKRQTFLGQSVTIKSEKVDNPSTPQKDSFRFCTHSISAPQTQGLQIKTENQINSTSISSSMAQLQSNNQMFNSQQLLQQFGQSDLAQLMNQQQQQPQLG